MFAGIAFLFVAPLCADVGEMTMRSFNVRMGCGQKDHFREIAADIVRPNLPRRQSELLHRPYMVDTKHADKVKVLSRKVIAAHEATDHCPSEITTGHQSLSTDLWYNMRHE